MGWGGTESERVHRWPARPGRLNVGALENPWAKQTPQTSITQEGRSQATMLAPGQGDSGVRRPKAGQQPPAMQGRTEGRWNDRQGAWPQEREMDLLLQAGALGERLVMAFGGCSRVRGFFRCLGQSSSSTLGRILCC